MIDLFTALLTPTIAAIAVYIAYQQWQTNRRKLEFDLYERRLQVYKGVDQFIHKVRNNGSPDLQDFPKLWRDTAEANFLFESDVKDYIEDLATHAADLWAWKEMYRDGQQIRPEGYDHKKVVKGRHDELKWFNQQTKEAPQIFAKYLNLTQKRPWFPLLQNKEEDPP